MFKLDKFQIDSINDIKKLNNVLVVAPTGSGKTLIAEKSVEYYLQNNKRIFYTTPIKALSNQKYNDFKEQNIDVGLLTGDRSINQDANLIIATNDISSGTGLFSEIINDVGPLNDTIQSRNSFLFFIVADKQRNFIFIGACINTSSHVVPRSLSPK